MSITKADLKHRILTQLQEFRSQNSGIKIYVATEVRWTERSDVKTYVKSITVSGAINHVDKTVPVEWRWQIDGAESAAVLAAANVLGDLRPDFRPAMAVPVEREIAIDVTPWLQLGLFYNGNRFRNAYIEFSSGSDKLRAELPNLMAAHEFARLLSPSES